MNCSQWYQDTLARLNAIEQGLGSREIKRVKLNKLQRIAARVDSFSLSCSECQSYRKSINEMAAMLEQYVPSGRFDGSHYNRLMRQMLKHLRTQHAVVEEGAYLSQWIAIGLCIGVAFMSLHGPAFMSIGFALGAAIGASFDGKAKKEGRVL